MKYWDILLDYYINIGLTKKFVVDMCISQKDAEIMAEFIEKSRPENILEIGTFIGFSTGLMSFVSNANCRIISIDLNLPIKANLITGRNTFELKEKEKSLEYAYKMLKYFGFSHKASLLIGFFSCYLPYDIMQELELNGIQTSKINIIGENIQKFPPFDFVFIDGDHSENGVYHDLSLVVSRIVEDAMILLHDIKGLWGKHTMAGLQRFMNANPVFKFFETAGNLGVITKIKK